MYFLMRHTRWGFTFLLISSQFLSIYNLPLPRYDRLLYTSFFAIGFLCYFFLCTPFVSRFFLRLDLSLIFLLTSLLFNTFFHLSLFFPFPFLIKKFLFPPCFSHPSLALLQMPTLSFCRTTSLMLSIFRSLMISSAAQLMCSWWSAPTTATRRSG